MSDQETGFYSPRSEPSPREEESPFEAITEDLRNRIIDWKGHPLAGLGPLQMFDLLSVRRDALVREFFVYLFKEAIICVAEEKKRTLGWLMSTASGAASAFAEGSSISGSSLNQASKGVLRLKGRIYIRHIRQVTDTSVQGELSLSSPMEVPRIQKITLNMGVGEAKTDAKQLDAAIEELSIIAGQRAQVRKATKSIAQFKIREGMPIGARVTLRGTRMYEFLDRLIAIALPRIRDFRGLNPGSFDGRGNYSLGIREQIIFPEIDYDDIQQVRGLDVAITTSAKTDEHGLALLRGLGMPFAADGREQ